MRRNILLFLLALLVSLFILISFLSLVFIFLRFERNNHPSDDSEIHEYTSYQFLKIDSSSTNSDVKVISRGVLSVPNDEISLREEEESITFELENQEGVMMMVSHFGDDEYICTGSCFCVLDGEQESERRRRAFPHITRKPLTYLVSAFSSLLAIQKANQYFSEECSLSLQEHEECSSIHSEVDFCQSVNNQEKIEKELEKELDSTQTLEQKRSQYYCGENYITPDQIPTWQEQHTKQKQFSQKVSLYQGDICVLEVDAIQNAANSELKGGGGIDGSIHKNAGWDDLIKETSLLFPDGCQPGEAVITRGYKLPAKYIIHTVGPIYSGKEEDEEVLRSCYKMTLEFANDEDIRTLSFCCVGTGVYGYPKKEACRIALEETRNWLDENNEKVDRIIFCVFGDDDKRIYEKEMGVFFGGVEDDQ